jgi:hypothetical protein
MRSLVLMIKYYILFSIVYIGLCILAFIQLTKEKYEQFKSDVL